MKFASSVIQMCFLNFRKWIRDYRIWTVAILLLILNLDAVRNLISLGKQFDIKPSIWFYPFLYSQRHMKLIYSLPLILMFYNAPFTDSNSCFVIVRSKRKAWLLGQTLYIIIASAIYYLFIMISLILMLFPFSELTSDWGELISNMSFTSIASASGYYFFDVSSFVITYFTPFQSIYFTFILSWFMGMMTGMIIYFFNTITGKKSTSIIICGFMMAYSCYVESLGNLRFRWISPGSWCTVDVLDVGHKTSNPTFGYSMLVYSLVFLSLFFILMINNKRWSLDNIEE